MESQKSLRYRLIEAYVKNPDRRTREYKIAEKQAYKQTIDELNLLVNSLEQNNKVLKTRLVKEGHDKRDDKECSICMEDMCGKVTLVCGHVMCPKCFAQHSRVNNTCPFCRNEFAPKPKRQCKMPQYQLEYIADLWANMNLTRDYLEGFHNGTETEARKVERLKHMVTANGKILMKKVKDWYDNDIV